MGRVLKVDHTRYKRKDDEEEAEREQALRGQNKTQNGDVDGSQASDDEGTAQGRPLLKEEMELAALIQNHDEDDPMKEYLVQEKKEEVAKAVAALNKKHRHSKGQKKDKHPRHHHHHRLSRSERKRIQTSRDASVSEGERPRRHRSPRRRSRSP